MARSGLPRPHEGDEAGEGQRDVQRHERRDAACAVALVDDGPTPDGHGFGRQRDPREHGGEADPVRPEVRVGDGRQELRPREVAAVGVERCRPRLVQRRPHLPVEREEVRVAELRPVHRDPDGERRSCRRQRCPRRASGCARGAAATASAIRRHQRRGTWPIRPSCGSRIVTVVRHQAVIMRTRVGRRHTSDECPEGAEGAGDRPHVRLVVHPRQRCQERHRRTGPEERAPHGDADHGERAARSVGDQDRRGRARR